MSIFVTHADESIRADNYTKSPVGDYTEPTKVGFVPSLPRIPVARSLADIEYPHIDFTPALFSLFAGQP
jgi:hypothetical protein